MHTEELIKYLKKKILNTQRHTCAHTALSAFEKQKNLKPYFINETQVSQT